MRLEESFAMPFDGRDTVNVGKFVTVGALIVLVSTRVACPEDLSVSDACVHFQVPDTLSTMSLSSSIRSRMMST